MDMEMDEPRVLEAGWQAMLAELHWRTERAYAGLDRTFTEEKRYYGEMADDIIAHFDLGASEASKLQDLAEKITTCLDEAYEQAEAKLQKLLTALEKNSVQVEPSPRGRKTLHIAPAGGKLHISAHRIENRWLFILPIHGISLKAYFPSMLKLSGEEIYYLQAGWRASDEGESKGVPCMQTAQAWQVLAWATVRYGYLRIYLGGLNLNKTKPTIHWKIIAKSWRQQWHTREGKMLAQQVAKRHPLGLLTWYLGDGWKHPQTLRFAVENDEEYAPKELAHTMLKAAYQTGYGRLLDLLGIEKWQALKKLQPKKHPVYAIFQGYTFWLDYWEGKRALRARALFKNPSEAEKLAKALADMGIQARINTWKTGYHVLQITGHNMLKLAEKSPEWRNALKQLAQKKNIQPKTPTLRRLLELAENPPKKFNIQHRFSSSKPRLALAARK